MIIFANFGPKLASNIDSSNINFKMYAITVSFTLILSQSITSFCFADEWKTAKVVPLHKMANEIFQEIIYHLYTRSEGDSKKYYAKLYTENMNDTA